MGAAVVGREIAEKSAHRPDPADAGGEEITKSGKDCERGKGEPGTGPSVIGKLRVLRVEKETRIGTNTAKGEYRVRKNAAASSDA